MQASEPGYFGQTSPTMAQAQQLAAEPWAEPVPVNNSGTLSILLFTPPESSPPGLFILHSSFLI